jgi:hypothetical protein
MAPEAIHALLSAEAQQQALPIQYVRDLTVHDLNDLARTGTQEFIWVLRDCGTHLIHLDVADIDGTMYSPERHLAGVVQFSDKRQLYYVFRTGTLTACTPEEAQAFARDARVRHDSVRTPVFVNPYKEA